MVYKGSSVGGKNFDRTDLIFGRSHLFFCPNSVARYGVHKRTCWLLVLNILELADVIDISGVISNSILRPS